MVTPKPARSSIEISDSGIRRVHDLSHIDQQDVHGMMALMQAPELQLTHGSNTQFLTTQRESLKKALNVIG